MNKTAIVAFGAGVILGAWGMWRYIHWQDKPIVKVSFNHNLTNNDISDESASEEERAQYNFVLSNSGYNADREEDKKAPYTIYPEEFGAIDDYETVSLLYFADGVLTDDRGEKVDDIADKVGADFYTHFGEYEEDSVFVRNEARKCDYEILMDSRNYEEVLALRPRRRHDETRTD